MLDTRGVELAVSTRTTGSLRGIRYISRSTDMVAGSSGAGGSSGIVGGGSVRVFEADFRQEWVDHSSV